MFTKFSFHVIDINSNPPMVWPIADLQYGNNPCDSKNRLVPIRLKFDKNQHNISHRYISPISISAPCYHIRTVSCIFIYGNYLSENCSHNSNRENNGCGPPITQSKLCNGQGPLDSYMPQGLAPMRMRWTVGSTIYPYKWIGLVGYG